MVCVIIWVKARASAAIGLIWFNKEHQAEQDAIQIDLGKKYI